MSIESKKLPPLTLDSREINTGYPSGIFKQKGGSTNITSMLGPPPPLLHIGVLTLPIISGLVTLIGLLLVSVTLILSLHIVTIAASVVTLISGVFTLMMVRAVWASLQDAIRVVRRRGLGKVITN